MKADLAAAEQQVIHAEKAKQEFSPLLDAARGELIVAEKAAADLESAGEEPRKSKGAEVINQSREDRSLAEERLAAFRAKTRADRIHASIQLNAAILGIIAVDGLRQKVLTDALTDFNESMADLAEKATWSPCIIESDLSVWYGTRPYVLSSKSEQYRAWVQLLIATALIDGSDVIVIDGVDILDRAGRNGLVTVLATIEIPAMIFLTILDQATSTGKDIAEGLGHALADKGWGAAWWIEDGVATRLQGES
jgi:hypothetical protein